MIMKDFGCYRFHVSTCTWINNQEEELVVSGSLQANLIAHSLWRNRLILPLKDHLTFGNSLPICKEVHIGLLYLWRV